MSTKTKDSSPEEINQVLNTLEIILRHQERVRQDCELMGKKLINQGKIDLGISLIREGRVHDLSKLEGIEFSGLNQTEDKKLLEYAILHHRKVNKHHAPYWGGIQNMPELHIAELVADLHARSSEFGTDLREYLKEEFFPRHNLTSSCRVGKLIKEYVEILLDKPFSKSVIKE